MSIPGWYPDPARQPGQFRYWDGAAWSTGTSANPADPPPRDPGGPQRPRRTGLIIAVIAVGVVLATVAFLVLRPGPDAVTVDPVPRATIRPENTSTPNATRTSAPVEPTPLPSSPRAGRSCPEGAPETRQPHPSDGLVHGGGLAFAPLAGWSSQPLPRRLSWAYDVGGQQTPSVSGQPAMVAVGALSTVDGFEAPEQAADLVLDCMTGSAFYPDFVDRRDIAAVSVNVDAYAGWRIRSVITYGTGSTASIDLVDVIVIDLGSPESLAMFWGTAPAIDQGLVRLLDRTVIRLQAS